MARPKKQTVDYFPHDCRHGKTIFALERDFGLVGYAFWWKLLEKLGSTEGHSLNFSDDIELEVFSAEIGVSAPETRRMLDLLARLKAIDREMWAKSMVWCQKFVDRLSEVYRKRGVSAPGMGVSATETPHSEVSDVGNRQTKVNKSKVITPTGEKPMDYNEPVIEIGDDGEPHPVLGKRQTFGRAPASIAKFYCLLVGKRSAGQQLPAAKELMRLSCEDFPEDSDEERMVEIEKRIELAKWHYDHHGVKDWNLQKVAENWSIILNEWTHEKRKHQ